MEVKDAMTLMLLFGTFILALLTYINNNKRVKPTPRLTAKGGFYSESFKKDKPSKPLY